LAICKPTIRRVAKPDDWVAGLGSKNAPSGDLSGKLVFAMKVKKVITLKEYDQRAPTEWPKKIPQPFSRDLADRLGDCIYDYKNGSSPNQRPGVHDRDNVKADLSGVNVLISEDFYYFGSKAIPLDPDLTDICHQSQGHKSKANAGYVDKFDAWMRGLGLETGQLYGWPDLIVDWSAAQKGAGCRSRAEESADDPVC